MTGNAPTQVMPGVLRRWWSWMHARPVDLRSFREIVAWWERRRISYNVALAAIGVPSLLLYHVLVERAGTVRPGEDVVEPAMLIVLPLLANVAYSAGWIVEGFSSRVHESRSLGPRLMRAGLLFSLAVIVLPTVLWLPLSFSRLAD